ncbi:MAG: hypothetical protein U0325_20920 [Polyangiales bacterium]
MSPTELPYRAPAAPGSRASSPRRVTAAQIALVAVASLGAVGALVHFAPRAASPPPDVLPPAAPPAPATLPLPPVTHVAPRPPSSATAPWRVTSGMDNARRCLHDSGVPVEVNACIARALEGRATTEPSLRLLCATWIQMGEGSRGFQCMEFYVRSYPGTEYARRFREILRRR